jgi:DNA polymerase
VNASAKDSRAKISRIALQCLEDLERAGVSHLPKAKRQGAKALNQASLAEQAEPSRPVKEESPAIQPTGSKPNRGKPLISMVDRSLFDSTSTERKIVPPEQRAAALDIIQREVASCVRCPALVANRTQTVFGVGNNTARICFFGEAPGADEDRLGEPFVGRGGQLLNKMIVACGLKREEVYIMNVLKCRPPDNRNPLPDEVVNCRGYFERQFDIIRPEIICCLGAVASQSLLKTDRSIGKLRGQFHDYQGIPVVCTYHPAYLLRNPSAKGAAWEDLKLMMRRLGIEL